MRKFVWIILILSVFSVGFRAQPTRYESEFVRVNPGETYAFYHGLATRPSDLDVWCALFLAVEGVNQPVVPCYDYPESDIDVIAVTSQYVSIANNGPGWVSIQVSAGN